MKNILLKIKQSFLWLSRRKFKHSFSLNAVILSSYFKTRHTFSRKICHAPFSNLFFSYDGLVGACCYNRTHIYGVYPNSSVKGLWHNNKERINLIKRINSIDLNVGCHPCKTQLEDGAFYAVLARNYDDLSPHKNYPSSIEFELSNKCNLQCIMCSEENSSLKALNIEGREEKIYPYDKRFVEEISGYIPHLKRAKFLGGEPFFIPIYYDIWDAFVKLNKKCEIVVQTNGTILNDSIKSLLQQANFSLSISIDAIDKHTYEHIRKGACFEKTFENLNYFIEFCKKNKRFIGITSCFMQQNWRNIPELINFCNRLDIPISFNRVWEPSKCSISGSSFEKIAQVQEYYETINMPTKTHIQTQNANAFSGLINQLISWKNIEISRNKCMANIEALSVKEIEELLLKRICIKNKKLNNANYVLLQEKFLILCEVGREKKGYKKMLIKMLEIPAEIFQSEISRNPLERLLKKMNQMLSE